MNFRSRGFNIAVVTAAALAANMAFAGMVAVDTKASTIEWTGRKVIGSSHTGNVVIKKGEIETKGNKITGGTIVVDMNSITNKDLTDPAYNKKLVGHLKSNDFFDVAKFPTATLKINEAKSTKNGAHKVKGALTIKNETHPVEFEAKLADGGKTVNVDLPIDRTIWNVRYGSGKFFKNLGDKVIADQFDLKVTLKFGSPVLASK